MRAHAWTTLGKLCLVDESLAKRTLPFFVQVVGERRRGVTPEPRGAARRGAEIRITL